MVAAHMKAGTIVFDGADLALYGLPSFTLRETPEPAAPARATRTRVDVIVRVNLRADMPATVWARARALQEILRARPEGLLQIIDENGGVTAWMARPGENSLPEAIRRGQGLVEMSFSATAEISAGADPLLLLVDPLDGSPEITLSSPTNWNTAVRPSRPDDLTAHRDTVTNTLTFSAKACHADPLLPAGARAEYLLEQAALMETMAGRQARFRFCGYDDVMQVESLIARPSDGWEWLEVEAQARKSVLPGETVAEVNFKEDSTTDPATGEIRTTISGSVRAPDKITANAKVDALLAAWSTSGRRLLNIRRTHSYLDGVDSDQYPDWTAAEFSVEFAQAAGGTRFTLQVQTVEGPEGNRITYSGTATAANLSALIATADTATKNKHPVELRYELTVDHITTPENGTQLAQGRFTREYQVAATVLRGTLTRSTSKGSFQDWQVTVQGSLSASSAAVARGIARTFIDAGVNLRTDDEGEPKAVYGDNQQLTAFQFTYSWGAAHSGVTMEYEDGDTPDYTRMTTRREVSGTAWAPDRAAAEAAVDALAESLMPGKAPAVKSMTASMEKSGSTRFLRLRFSLAWESKLTGSIGHDIIEASFSLQRIGQINHIPMTEIPLDFPREQIPFGHTIGMMVASGGVKARVKSTAISWGQGKRPQAQLTNGREDPPDERITESYVPFSGTEVAVYQFDFQYSFRHASGLTGLM